MGEILLYLIIWILLGLFGTLIFVGFDDYSDDETPFNAFTSLRKQHKLHDTYLYEKAKKKNARRRVGITLLGGISGIVAIIITVLVLIWKLIEYIIWMFSPTPKPIKKKTEESCKINPDNIT